MTWQQLAVDAGDVDPDELSAFFETHGALSVTLVDAADQPLFEPDPGTTPLWSATRVTGLFADDVDLASLKQALAARFGAALAARTVAEAVADQDWERAWLDRFQPMRFGEHLWICPAGQRPPVEPGQVLIDLDPGLAFGTGTHPTTSLCLAWLDGHPPLDRQVLDFGCGSGILAIAALKLGAASVWAVDIDEQALWSSRENAARNQVAGKLLTGLPDALPAQRFDLLLANILANPLIELAPRLAGLLDPGGQLVLSGILSEQAAGVQQAYEPWFRFSPGAEQDGWVRLQAVRTQVGLERDVGREG
ncbi:MAG: 50S ribosomal protein L11 methyltransferase [Thiogranum sp.]